MHKFIKINISLIDKNFQQLGLVVLFVLTSSLAYAQSDARKSLEERKAKILEEIRLNERLLQNQVMQEKSVLSVIMQQQSKIQLRTRLIQTTEQQMRLLQQEINRNEAEIKKLSEELEVLKNDYAQMIEKSYKNRSERSRLMFLLSSESFLQAYKRSQYIKQYANYRKSQGEELKVKSAALAKANEDLEKQKVQKQRLVAENEAEKNALEEEKKKQEVLVQSLKKDQKRIAAEIKQKQQEAKKIDAEIQRMIREAIVATNKKTGNTPSKSGEFALTPEGKIISNNFKANRGKLPWPVVKGTVSQRFGTFPHPVVKTLMQENNGIEISTEKGTQARSIFEGEVIRIIVSTPINKTVMIRHGDFVSVYKNLETLQVKTGDKVSLGQNLGMIHTNEFSGKTILKFYITQNENFLNPEQWLIHM